MYIYNLFSFLLDFCTNPKFNMAPIQKLQRVNIPKYSYCIHIFLILDSCFQFNTDARGKVQECCEVINKSVFKNAKFT